MKKPITCQNCLGYSWSHEEYVPASGTGDNGVLICAEAAGEHEAKEAMPLVGAAGSFLFKNLARAGIEREGFKCHNCLSCRPPNNFLAKAPYEQEVINYCAPLLDQTIADMHETCNKNKRHLVILTLGRIAFKRIMGLDDKSPIVKGDYLTYPFWSDKYKCFVIAADHPSFLMRGNAALTPVLQYATSRALEIAEHGLEFHKPNYMRDPDPATFAQWVSDYKEVASKNPDTYLAFDIETPHKQGQDEEKVSKEEDTDYTILRTSFSYKRGEAVSVLERAEYLAALEEIFGTPYPKVGWNSEGYDLPRIRARRTVNGDCYDGMLMWHVLNSALPKGLGFVSPFYCKDIPMWKHTSDIDPAGYNAMDSDVTLRNFFGIKADLVRANQWNVFERHVVQLNKVLGHMSEKGVLRDEVMRAEAETRLSKLLDEVEVKMEDAVPQEARKLKVYKKTPKVIKEIIDKENNGWYDLKSSLLNYASAQKAKDATGMIQIDKVGLVKRCSICSLINPKKPHFKPVSAKKKKLGLANVCENGEVIVKEEPIKLWAKPLEFKVSKVSLLGYQKALKQNAIIDRRENKVTFDEKAIAQLQKKYPHDKLYPLILLHREYTKLLSTYIGVTQENGFIKGGMPAGKDNKIRTVYSHNPSTLRLASQQPNLQNLPRSRNGDDLQTIVRNLIVAGPECIFIELDFSGIEAVLVGYFAGSADYIRLAKLGIHSFLASHVLGKPADLSWSDADLKAYFKEIKKSKDQHIIDIYMSSKKCCHLSAYGGTPHKMHIEEPEAFPTIKDAERLQGIYFEVCPYIKKWQYATQLQADKDGFLRNPFSYTHRFYNVFSYKKECGKWVRKPGADANKVLAFLPQSTAAGIIKEAMLRLYYNRFEEAGQYLRLQVHDSLVAEVPLELVESVKAVMKEEMEREIPELRLPASYKLGDCLTIDVEAKTGIRYGTMS